MTTFELISVLISIIVGLAAARLLNGLARTIELRRQIRFYWIQGLWSGTTGVALVLFWWATVRSYSGHSEWLYIDFLSLIFYSIILYLVAVLIVPGEIREGTDLEAHFYSVRPWFFSFVAVGLAADGLDTLKNGVETFLSFGPQYVIFLVVGIGGNLVAARTSNRRFHGAWALWSFFWCVLWGFSQFWAAA